ncbi:S-layer homology domain-containing protein [Tissierellaceae bacterium HCP3S3_D8]
MKRAGIMLVIVILLMSTTVAFASMEDKLDNHWSKNSIDRSFLTYYFPYLSRDNFEKLDPDGSISAYEFSRSAASLFRDNGYNISILTLNANLNRNDMVKFLGQKLENIGFSIARKVELPFKDINTMEDNSIELLRILYGYEIIVGKPNSTFNPNGDLSQAEAIIILQRVKEVLSQMKSIPFKTLGVVQSFNNQEGIVTIQDGNNILVTITKQFPTPGYFMAINKVVRQRDGFRIYFDIKPPKPDSIQLQVATYKTITIEIEKDRLGEPPYNFILDGYNKVRRKEML